MKVNVAMAVVSPTRVSWIGPPPLTVTAFESQATSPLAVLGRPTTRTYVGVYAASVGSCVRSLHSKCNATGVPMPTFVSARRTTDGYAALVQAPWYSNNPSVHTPGSVHL